MCLYTWLNICAVCVCEGTRSQKLCTKTSIFFVHSHSIHISPQDILYTCTDTSWIIPTRRIFCNKACDVNSSGDSQEFVILAQIFSVGLVSQPLASPKGWWVGAVELVSYYLRCRNEASFLLENNSFLVSKSVGSHWGKHDFLKDFWILLRSTSPIYSLMLLLCGNAAGDFKLKLYHSLTVTPCVDFGGHLLCWSIGWPGCWRQWLAGLCKHHILASLVLFIDSCPGPS